MSARRLDKTEADLCRICSRWPWTKVFPGELPHWWSWWRLTWTPAGRVSTIRSGLTDP